MLSLFSLFTSSYNQIPPSKTGISNISVSDWVVNFVTSTLPNFEYYFLFIILYRDWIIFYKYQFLLLFLLAFNFLEQRAIGKKNTTVLTVSWMPPFSIILFSNWLLFINFNCYTSFHLFNCFFNTIVFQDFVFLF